ncbi:MAG: hypothetical protein A2126_01065 [Candidatus Woykebacteria bacterium GWB1_45_5]|uniref:Uncharacterized protein n=2 Tax=Candidatus Woykeibacteriota TaxID=1817899 RepID=A0A1G1W301_9BACT|nr:MAG: hypothetical protein A2113_02490 [Candidatus Woykebacteria bacterium GWA1_44_8]OGY22741.1 MAG: hypothetical protein A2126_01065 [Candidatus Woykebacteria bacterium GWB1_45_5]
MDLLAGRQAFPKGRFTLSRNRVREILRRRREEAEAEREEVLDSLAQIERRLRRVGYQAASSDYVGRLRLSKARLFLRELGYMTISELEESCLNGTGIFEERSQDSEFIIVVREEVTQALIEYRENRLKLLFELAAKN